MSVEESLEIIQQQLIDLQYLSTLVEKLDIVIAVLAGMCCFMGVIAGLIGIRYLMEKI